MTRFAPCLAVLTLACTQEPLTSPDIKEPARADVVVQISSASVEPAVARLKEDGSVAWANSSDSLAVVSFPGSDASQLGCKELRPDFTNEGNTLESLPFRGGAYPIVLPCSLKKGRYPYVIKLVNSIQELGNPVFTLSAEIRVE
jgi:hypothetical protein